ncbi:MAG: hypothetical protein AB7T39_20965 [Alphaproteobacteria bacterium]
MSAGSSPVRLAVIGTLALAGLAAAQVPDARTAQVDAAIAARRSDSALEACLAADADVRSYRTAIESLANVGNPKWAAKFNCSGIGASWQEVAPEACCSVFNRDKGRNTDAAWNALQSCGWRAKIEERRPAYLRGAEKCLGAAGPATAPTPPSVAGGTDPWAGAPSAETIRQRVRGRDAFAVMPSGGVLQVFDTNGGLRPLPGYLADRIRSGYAVLDDRAWLQSALTSLGLRLTVNDALAAMAQGTLDIGRQFVWFGDEVVRHQLPGSSVRTMGGQFCSSEHATIRGSINGGGDFIYCPLWEQFGIPSESGKRNWQFEQEFYRRFLPPETFEQLRRDAEEVIALGRTPRPGIRPAAWRAAGRSTLAQSQQERVWVELATATVASADPLPVIITDLAPNGATAVVVLAGRVRVTETRTGASRLARRGDAVLVWPGAGISQPVRVSAARFTAAARPRIRGSIVLRPGERWTGRLQLHDLLTIESRLLWDKPAGAAYALEVLVNGKPLAAPLVNKTSPLRYADGRNYPYREPDTARWMLFYSPDYAANNGSNGGGYEVRTDPGQAYRYVWDVSAALGGNPTASVEFRNTIAASAASLELRLMPTALWELADFSAGRRSTADTASPSSSSGSAVGLTEREPNDTEAAAMPLPWGATVQASSAFGTSFQDRDYYVLNGANDGRYTLRLTPGACPLWFSLPSLGPSRTLKGPATIVIERLGSASGGTRIRTTTAVEGQPPSTAESVKTGLPDQWLLAVENAPYSTKTEGGRRLVQCAAGGPWLSTVPYAFSVIAEGARTAAPATTAPATAAQPSAGGATDVPRSGVVRGGDFGDPAVPQGRVFDLVTARGVEGGRPIGRTSEFLPGDNPIYVRFGIEGFSPGTVLTTRWTYFGSAAPMVIGTGEVRVTPGTDYGTFSFELAEGKRWPAGSYQAEVLQGDAVLGHVAFSVVAAGR